MIGFITTFPPHVCGIATYTKYLCDRLPSDSWRVISFRKDEFATADLGQTKDAETKVQYCISLDDPRLPDLRDIDVVWVQHAFGMWGGVPDQFLKVINEAKERGKKVVVTFHTIHFQSNETPWGMDRVEEEILRETLPVVDAITVFTDGARKAVISAFPHYSSKVVVLRHGVHLHESLPVVESRKALMGWLEEKGRQHGRLRKDVPRLKNALFSPDTVLMGSYGFVTKEKDTLGMFRLADMVQEGLKGRRVVALFSGIVQKRKDKELDEYRSVVKELMEAHNGIDRFFIEAFLPEELFGLAYGALDFAPFWCRNATQSGRMAHAQGTGTCVIGRDWEGIGETLRIAGLPCAHTLEELAEKVIRLINSPEEMKAVVQRSLAYARQYSYLNQARKHLMLSRALANGQLPPNFDSMDVHERTAA